MKIMLDCSPAKIMEYRKRYDHDFWQLRTPLTGYARAGVPYGLDNGCFKTFDQQAWMRLIEQAHGGRQQDFIRLEPAEACSSLYGLCE